MFEQKTPPLAVIGTGYWGKNLLRNFYETGAVKYIFDTREDIAASLLGEYPKIQKAATFGEILADPALEAIALATPAETHFDLARQALLAGKHVFVEKPLCLTAAEGRELAELAAASRLVLMADHLLTKHPAYLKLAEMVRAGELGRLRHIRGNRLNFGKIRATEDVLWSFGPHDLSMILGLAACAGQAPESVSAFGRAWLTRGVADRVDCFLDFSKESELSAALSLSWLNPVKEHKLVVVGDRKMAVFDDTLPWPEKLCLYAHRACFSGPAPTAAAAPAEYVPLEAAEPLKIHCRDFLRAVSAGEPPDAGEYLAVLEALEALSASLAANGARRRIEPVKSSCFVHPTSIVDDGVKIGRGTKIWHFSHILSGSELGENCNLGQNVVVGPNVKIGNGVKLQNNVSVYEGITLEDDVFCGPSMVFTNVFNPRANVSRKHEYRPTLVKRGATVGANATVVCGNTLGEWCFVGAGVVVTRDVPPHALMMGNPARRRGWVCRCGVKLSPGLRCEECGLKYCEHDGMLSLERESNAF